MTKNESINQSKMNLSPAFPKKGLKRRGFLGTLSAGALAAGFSMLKPLAVVAEKSHQLSHAGDPDEWFNQIKGEHRIVFDATEPLPMPVMPFAWPRIFLITNAATGTPEKDCSVVMVLRHNAFVYGLGSPLWKKYDLGKMFKVTDPVTKEPATRNPFWKPAPGTYTVPGVGEVKIGIDELQQSGVLICVCDVAITVFSAAVAQQMNLDAAEVKKEWEEGVIPGVQLMPSGIWAIGRAQEHKCAYCKAG